MHVIVLVLLALIGSVVETGAQGRPAANPEVKTRVVVNVPQVTLTRSDGVAVSLAEELDAPGPVLLNFIFTTCTTICPVMSATFGQLQSDLGPDLDRVRLVSVTIDPDYDTPARLSAYAREHNAGSNWRFLTGTPADIRAIQKAFGTYQLNKMAHAPLTFLRATSGSEWVRINGLVGAKRLVQEYRALAKDAN